MHAELLVLRFVHIVGGIFWVGALTLTSFFLAPAIFASGAAGGQVMANLVKRKLMVVLPVVALLVILSGLRLLMIVSGNSPGYFATPMGRTYAIAGLLAVVGFLLGVLVSRPGMTKVGRLSQSAASDETSRELITTEIQKIQKRIATSNRVTAVLLLLSATGMALARYL